MAMDEVLTVKDAVHKLQISLLEGIKDENQLFAAGSLMSQSDYQDVVTERTIANMCGYPLCINSLPSERPRKGHFRISLKEHKVYDLHETYMYCSSSCLINSRAFVGSLQEERSSTLNLGKLNEVLNMFEGLSLNSKVDIGKNGDLGLSELKIQEKTDTKAGEVSVEEWIGPSNAIEGYVPQRDINLKPRQSKNLKKESKPNRAEPNKEDIIFNDMNFSSTIITQDEYSISKLPGPRKIVTHMKGEEPKGKVSCEDARDQDSTVQNPDAPMGSMPETKLYKSDKYKYGDDKLNVSEVSPGTSHPSSKAMKEETDYNHEKLSTATFTKLKSSLKTSDAKKAIRSVTWADGNARGEGKNLCESRELDDKKEAVVESNFRDTEVGEESFRFSSAEACAKALIQAAEAVASEKSDVSDAVSEAGVIILPPPREVDEAEPQENGDVMDTDPSDLKWPSKPGFPNYDLFDSEDSWYDSHPEGFSLTLSPFSTMFMALFSWISSSSVAYIYGRDESYHEEYLSINGREYPGKIVMEDGRSSEIKLTLAGCLARSLPGLVAELRLPTPISTLEQGIARLLDTMSFADPLPSFRMKQWQVIVLLFLDALSVSRIPALTQYMTGRRVLLPKVRLWNLGSCLLMF
ncbi:RNA polymerase II subunit B1 CTD phosphatase RPAP2 homolog isoform X1 [Olea europaea subsp. europaea]|uniref:RNA polymerase II subunit B1 CTD phosphatase RPAP2 homolog n=1 Tax=Olea europaea subsp. europaea TaxID=158383 RepID=A0A8S0RY80_OLEEU|nr:RNA polymerase II subunit B1 CTD phosphatase RPAP2 homolog isoform X1 [Olea europaea subsp. europaea]